MTTPYHELHGRGHPLLLLPGFASDLQSWIFVRDTLAQRHQVVLMDPRGIGRTPGPPYRDNTLDMATDVLKVMDATGLEKADVLGHSMGGAIAQELALLAPDRVRRLVLVSSFSLGSILPTEVMKTWMRAVAGPVDEALLASEVLPWIYSEAYLRFPNRIRSIAGFLRANRFPPSVEGMRGQVAAIESHDTSARVAGLAAPTLVMVGKLDRLTSPASNRELAGALPNARYLEIDGAAHAVMLEQPDAFCDAVLEFLNN